MKMQPPPRTPRPSATPRPTPTRTMDYFTAGVGTDTAPGACFLLDDVWLEKLP